MKYLIKKIGKFSELLVFLGKRFVMLAMMVMTVITTIEVFRRYFFGLSYKWSEESVRYLLIWTTFVGASVVFKEGQLVYFNLLIGRLNFKNTKLITIILNMLTIILAITIFYYSVMYALSDPIMMQKSTGLDIPMYYVYFSIPVGMFMIIVFSINNILIEVYNKKGMN